MQVIDCIRRAGDRFSAPTPQYGYGIPTFESATQIARDKYPITGITDWIKPVEAFVYPNPVGVSSSLQVHWGTLFIGKKVNVELVDATGKVLVQQTVMANEASGKITLPTHIVNGSYFLKMNDNEHERVLKVIK
jgi:serine protease AprX